jgi:hypothetical protein
MYHQWLGAPSSQPSYFTHALKNVIKPIYHRERAISSPAIHAFHENDWKHKIHHHSANRGRSAHPQARLRPGPVAYRPHGGMKFPNA